MPSLLAVSIQVPVRHGAVDVNTDLVVQRLTEAARLGARFAVLPDMWTTGGLTTRSRRDSELGQGAVDEVRRIAARYEMVVVGSTLTCDRGLFYDEAHVIDADGELVGRYRRVHLVGTSSSDFVAGRETPTFPTAIGRIGVLLADDLYFPEQAVSLAARHVRLIAAPVAWDGPEIREAQTIAMARAIENQVFMVVANRARDTFESEAQGGSLILDPEGNALATGGGKDEIVAQEIDPDEAYVFRTRRPLMRARCPAAYGAEGESVEVPSLAPAPEPGRVLERDEMAGLADELHGQGKKLVFTNGCFDILHVGHVRYLRRARALGDALCIGLNSDASVRAIKGPERPIQAEDDRAELLASLACVDYVVVFEEETPLELITAVQPDVLVKGGDWTPETTVGREVVEERGGRVAILDYIEDRSTTHVIDRIRNTAKAPDDAGGAE